MRSVSCAPCSPPRGCAGRVRSPRLARARRVSAGGVRGVTFCPNGAVFFGLNVFWLHGAVHMSAPAPSARGRTARLFPSQLRALWFSLRESSPLEVVPDIPPAPRCASYAVQFVRARGVQSADDGATCALGCEGTQPLARELQQARRRARSFSLGLRYRYVGAYEGRRREDEQGGPRGRCCGRASSGGGGGGGGRA